MDIKESLNKICSGISLNKEEMKKIMDEIILGNLKDSEISGLLIDLKSKGESKDEILGIVESLRGNMLKMDIEDEYLIDTCGTGGDGGKTFNISTITAIVAASGGVKISKHGNRSISSKCGSKDVLEELSINSDLSKEDSKRMILDCGMSFLFAQSYHKGMKNVSGIRRKLGVRTIFNLIGPLINPAPLKGQLVGIYDKEKLQIVAEVLLDLGLERGLVVHSEDGLDEISLSAPTNVSEIKDGKIINYKIEPEDFDLERCLIKDVLGGTPKENAKIILDILKGEKGPKRDIVLLNSGAALYVGNKVGSIYEGVRLARKLIDSKKALDKYLELRRVSNSLEAGACI